MIRPRRIGALAGVALLVLAGCGGGEPEPQPGEAYVEEGPSTGHVHAVGVDPADGSVVIAAHGGLFRAAEGDAAARATGDARDAMGFTVAGPRRYVASGHPAPGADEPGSVGLIRSTDAGATWDPVSLAGEADLHVLEVAPGGRIYGFDAVSGALLASRDAGRTWRRTTVPPVLDLAVDPEDPDTVVAATGQGLLRSTDGGRRFRPAATVPASHLAWTAANGLLLLGTDGAVRRIPALGEPPETVGSLPGPPAAAAVHEDEVLVAQDDGSVHVSRDGGRTWTSRLDPVG